MVLPCSDRISRVPPYSNPLIFNTRTGLSPTMALLSRSFQLEYKWHWPGPRSLAATRGISVDVFSSGYLDVSVRRVRLVQLCIHCTIPLRVGFPIQKSAGQRSLAPRHSLSQPVTSFIASIRLGIHQMLLIHLRTPPYPENNALRMPLPPHMKWFGKFILITRSKQTVSHYLIAVRTSGSHPKIIKGLSANRPYTIK